MSEIDWTNDEAVVRASVPSVVVGRNRGRSPAWVYLTDAATGRSMSGDSENTESAWAFSRRYDPTVQVYERQHNPAYASPTPMCGQIYEGDAGARAGAVCVRPMGHASYHGTELDALTAGGGFYWHDRTPAEIAKDASPTQASAELAWGVPTQIAINEFGYEAAKEFAEADALPDMKPAPAALEEVVLPKLNVNAEDRAFSAVLFDGRPSSLLPTREMQDTYLTESTEELHCRERQLLAALTDNRDLRARIALMRDAFEGYIRDRHHRVDMSDMEIAEIINEWQDIAQEPK